MDRAGYPALRPCWAICGTTSCPRHAEERREHHCGDPITLRHLQSSEEASATGANRPGSKNAAPTTDPAYFYASPSIPKRAPDLPTEPVQEWPRQPRPRQRPSPRAPTAPNMRMPERQSAYDRLRRRKMMSIEPRNEPQMLRWFRIPFSPSPAREQEATVRLGPARRFVLLSIAGDEQSEKETKE